jgi:DNA polymerase sigma
MVFSCLSRFKKTYGRFQTLPILTTRVPIIIVTHLQSGITIDISVADSTNPFKTMIMRELYEREPCALMLTVAVKVRCIRTKVMTENFA